MSEAGWSVGMDPSAGVIFEELRWRHVLLLWINRNSEPLPLRQHPLSDNIWGVRFSLPFADYLIFVTVHSFCARVQFPGIVSLSPINQRMWKQRARKPVPSRSPRAVR